MDAPFEHAVLEEAVKARVERPVLGVKSRPVLERSWRKGEGQAYQSSGADRREYNG